MVTLDLHLPLFRKKKRDVYKYTWLRMAEGRVVDRALMDYVLLPERMLGRLIDVKVFRGEGGGMSDHFLVDARLKFVGGLRRAGRTEGVRNVLKVSELNNSVKEMTYQESLHGQYEVWSGGEVDSVELENVPSHAKKIVFFAQFCLLFFY